MKATAFFLIVALLSSSAAVVRAQDCPCFRASDLAGEVHSFRNGEEIQFQFETQVSTLLSTNYQRRFQAREHKIGFGGTYHVYHSCDLALLENDLETVASTQGQGISQDEFEACRSLIVDYVEANASQGSSNLRGGNPDAMP